MPTMYLPGGREIGIPDPPKRKAGEPEVQPSYQLYPKALYKDEPDAEVGTPYTTILVESAEAEAALGDEWRDKPAAWTTAPKAPTPKKAKVG